MLTEREIKTIFNPRDGQVGILANPAKPDEDGTLSVIAERLERFSGSALNPNKVKIDDLDVAMVVGTDEKNPTAVPYFAYIFRHKKTGNAFVSQISSKYGWMIPFGVVAEISELASK